MDDGVDAADDVIRKEVLDALDDAGDGIRRGVTDLVPDFEPKVNPKITIKGISLSVREKLLSSVSNEKLINCIKEMYRPDAVIGDGGLADAIRYEIRTGQLVGGKSHIQKGTERVTNLENIIAKQSLTDIDMQIANQLLNNLKNALKLGGYY